MEKEIKLYNRYNEGTKLVQVGNEDSLKYQLVTSQGIWRCGFDESTPNKYTFIDPPGGPFIAIGTKIGDHIVKSIDKNGIIEFE